MDGPAPNYLREFAKSPQHVVFGLLTLGLGFISAVPLGLIAGVTAYALGWIYLPDSGFFRNWIDRKRESSPQTDELQKLEQFLHRRTALIAPLSPQRQERYERLAAVCRDIEAAGNDGLQPQGSSADPRMRKIDELTW